jgi:hypothetical protein
VSTNPWWKSSYSSESANCVEVSLDSDGLAMRDSKDPSGPVLTYDHAAWRNFVQAVAQGEFDRPARDTVQP